ncbi:MAG: nucleotidyltransferase family protein [Planctomicrobium sp.]|jgi:molybdenum cofactor cytidylyltransferase|nr:nucleotidyltransferase family protein [Planctomicrobium sp.]
MTSVTPSIHAIIPAAGRSRRMGKPKLLLTIGEMTLIERLIRQLQRVEISSISVLVREDDPELQEEVVRCGASLVVPDHEPQEMRESVGILLSHLEQNQNPTHDDGWLLIPADHPIVLPSVLKILVMSWQENPNSIAVPKYQSRRGHPTIFPWLAAKKLEEIPPRQGLNWLLKNQSTPMNEVQIDEPSVLWDVDTPEDFARICKILDE